MTKAVAYDCWCRHRILFVGPLERDFERLPAFDLNFFFFDCHDEISGDQIKTSVVTDVNSVF